VDNVDPKVEGAFEAMIFSPMFASLERGLGPLGSTAFESALTQLLERGDG
jgi:hypothetical protein